MWSSAWMMCSPSFLPCWFLATGNIFDVAYATLFLGGVEYLPVADWLFDRAIRLNWMARSPPCLWAWPAAGDESPAKRIWIEETLAQITAAPGWWENSNKKTHLRTNPQFPLFHQRLRSHHSPVSTTHCQGIICLRRHVALVIFCVSGRLENLSHRRQYAQDVQQTGGVVDVLKGRMVSRESHSYHFRFLVYQQRSPLEVIIKGFTRYSIHRWTRCKRTGRADTKEEEIRERGKRNATKRWRGWNSWKGERRKILLLEVDVGNYALLLA